MNLIPCLKVAEKDLEYNMRLGEIHERYGIMTSVDNVRFDLLGMIIRQREAEREKQNETK